MTKPAELFAGLPVYASFEALLAAHPNVNLYPSFGMHQEAPLTLAQARQIERYALRRLRGQDPFPVRQPVAALRRVDLIETASGLAPWMVGFEIYAEKAA